ncbi:tetratricopeptide repeat domain protein [Coleofasciculus chthonoplastes PCC 7420]|uniref:Tetratricopeptide repeat domain protein n=1 Tax=Coleofasciculus chthonoplastes PCC 7420 TaxID=118168 RepID=B4VGZ6_9CYAN|nr:tetratricopeptide repeat protein [Coleofasciculus chthonoplastes]EDX78704.1 tetratricopeptide repeat domain protein [Coleofasciculus chthonoplastes PCC 7420]
MAVTLKASKPGREKVDQARRKKGWTATAAAWYQDAKTSAATLKRFRRGLPIQQDAFIGICQAVGIENWQEIVDENSTESTVPPVTFTAYAEETWVGRTEIITQWREKLRGNCRILLITGITGQGKTALAERLAVELQQEWQYLPPVTFDDETIRDFVSAAEKLLRNLNERVTTEDRKHPDLLLNRLVQKLRRHPYLVQIDSLEALLFGKTGLAARTEFQEPYKQWWQFFQAVLVGTECQSRLIVTSQELPTSFASCKFKTWQNIQLPGLSYSEQLELFEKHLNQAEVTISPEAKSYLERIGKAYEGHPLVIEVIAGEILAEFAGDVVGYWQRYQQEFAAIEAVPGNDALQLKVKERVRISLGRLARDVSLGFNLLLSSSVYRRPVPESFWFAMLGDTTEAEKATVLNTLKLRALVIREGIQGSQVLLRQHNLVRNTAYELLKTNNESAWYKAHKIAAQMWLNAYQPEPNRDKIEQVQAYLEAFHHFYQIEDWKKALDILEIEPISGNNLLRQLLIWGYYREIIIYSQQYLTIAREIGDRKCEAKALGNLGNAYQSLGEYSRAIEYHQQRLTIVKKIGDRQDEGGVLGDLGNAYDALGDYRLAIKYHQPHLTIAREIGDRYGEECALGNLSNAYDALGDYSRAIDYLQQCLTIAREIGDRYGEGTALGNLGNTYRSLGDYSRAIEYHQQHLTIAREIGDRNGEGRAWGNLGNAYHALGDYNRAIEYNQQHLTIAKEIGDRCGEGIALGNLGITYDALGDYSCAINCYQQSLTIAREIGDRYGEGFALGCLGNAYASLEDYSGAIKYNQQSLIIAREIGNRQGEGNALGGLGNAYKSLGNYSLAIEYHQQHFTIAREIGNRYGEGCALGNIGVTFRKLEQYSEALDYSQKALEIFQEIGDRSSEAEAFKNLAEIHYKLGNFNLALDYCKQALTLATALGIPPAKDCQELKDKLEADGN